MQVSPARRFFSLVNREPSVGRMALAFVACLIMSPIVYLAASDARFILDGERVEARVAGPATALRAKFGRSYRVPYAYTDTNGRQHTGEAIRRVADIEPGDAIAVRYLRSDPGVSKAESGVGDGPTWLVAAIACGLFAWAIWSDASGVRGVLHQVRAGAPVIDRCPSLHETGRMP